MLLENFTFQPPDEDIVWLNSGVLSPVTKGREKETPHLPLKVSFSKVTE